MSFIENKGQWLANVQFKSELSFGNIYFEKDNFTFILLGNEKHNHNSKDHDETHHDIYGHHFKIKFLNANEDVSFSQENKSGNYNNYFLGNNSNYWASHVHSFKAITYHNLYEGINMKVEGIGDNMKYEYYIAPYSNPSNILVKYEGIDDLKIKDGNLIYNTSIVGITELKPVVFQIIDDKKVYIPCEYKLNNRSKTVQFNLLEDYDESIELVIDPTLIFASYSASTLNNFGFTATYDNEGNLFGGGIVYGTSAGLLGYPSINSFNLNDTTHGGVQNGGFISEYMNHGYAADIAISKFSTDGITLLYSTLIGGLDNEQPQSLVTDSAGNLYIYGRTFSEDFPVTANAYDNTHNDSADIVIVKISEDGGTLLGSTFVGGSNADGVNMQAQLAVYGELKFNYADDGRGEIILDNEGNVYVASTTQSTDIFPGNTSFQDTFTGGLQDACVFKLNNDLSSMVWGSYLGGSNNDAGYSLKLDGLGFVFVAGGTNSVDFPNTIGSLNPTYKGGQADGFLAKIDTNGTVLNQSTYIGTSSYDQSFFIEIDEFNDVFTYGQTTGAYPVSSSVYSNPNSTQFIHKLNNDLTTTEFSTVFGSGDSTEVNISPTAFLVDYCGNIYISGWGGTTNRNSNNPNATGFTNGMPVTPDAFQSTTDGSDFYIMVLDKGAENLLYATFFGGNQNFTGGSGEHVDGGTSRFDKNGIIYQAVCASCNSFSNNFPTTSGAWSETNAAGSGCNLGVIKMEVYIPPTIVDVDASPTATGCVPLTVNFEANIVNVNLITWDFGDGSFSNLEDPIHTFTDTGTYTIRLIGEDTSLCNLADTAYLSVIVGDDSLVANFIDDIILDCYNSSISLHSENYPTTEYFWTMGDGTTYNTDSVYHQYLNPGDYPVKLVITDSTSCELTDSAETIISILPIINADFAISDTFSCIPLLVNYTNLTNIVVDSLFWSFGDGNNSNLQNPSNSYVNVGTYPVQLIAFDSNSCNLSDTAYSQVTTIDEFADADITVVETLFLCNSLQVDVHSNAIKGSHFWNFGDGTTSSDSATTHTYLNEGIYTISYILFDSTKICSPYDTAFHQIYFQSLVADFQISDSVACVPFEFNYNTDSIGQSYLWNFGNGNFSSSQSGIYNYLNVGVYNISLIVEDTLSCNVIDTAFVQITIEDSRVEALVDFTILNSCDSLLSIQIDNQSINGNDYEWQFDGANIQNVEEPGIYDFNTMGNHTIQLIVRNDSLCNPLDTIIENFDLLPNTNAYFEAVDNCENTIIQFENNSSPGANYNWDFGDGNISNEQNPSLEYTESGFYTIFLTVLDSNTCNVLDTHSAEVNIINQTDANFITDSLEYLYPDDVYFTNLSQNFTDFIWDFGDGTTDNEEENPVHAYKILNDISPCLTVWNDYCADTICKNIFIDFQSLIGVPNAFSPNADNLNDIIYVEGTGIEHLNFKIYNRWGILVFESNNQLFGWDGTYNGIPQEMEVYTYIVDALFLNEESVILKGNITLMR